jgi:small conductance mechanosensitive channel
MRRIGGEMKSEPAYAGVMLEPVEIFGIENFTDTTVTITARVKTQPAQQHFVGREFRRRLKYALQTEQIEFSAAQTAESAKAPSATLPPTDS